MKTTFRLVPLLAVLFSVFGMVTSASAQCENSGNGSIGPGDATMNDRLFRDGTESSSCASPKSCPGNFGSGGSHYYDTYTFTNATSSPQCYTLETAHLTGDGTSLFDAVYLTSFNPASLCTNYLADAGNSLTANSIVFSVPANTSFVVVIMSGGGSGTGDYSFVVKGLLTTPVAGIPAISVSGSADCTNPVQLTGTASGNNFVVTGPNGYVFSNVHRTAGTYPFIAANITSSGQYVVNAYTNGCLTASQVVTVSGSGCGNKSGISPVAGKINDL